MDFTADRRAKIICTLGPAVDDDDQIARLIDAGMDAARLNLSFGTTATQDRLVDRLRRQADRVGRPVALIADIPGPKVRLRTLEDNRVTLETGRTVRFVPDDQVPGTAATLRVDPRFFHDNMIRGDRIFLSNGRVELEVSATMHRAVEAEIIHGGPVGTNTAVHLPSVFLRDGPITREDIPHLEWALDREVDFIALTYVRNAQDLLDAEEQIRSRGRESKLIAKIERPEAFARLDSILARSQAVMVRRGDLGANLELTTVPAVQKRIVHLANSAGVPVILATQMLGSMVSSYRPTRAEASDVSNAIVDGADAVLLSAETAIGSYAVEAVEMMNRIIVATERELDIPGEIAVEKATFADTAAAMACKAAAQLGATRIVCFTKSGETAGLVAKYRPQVPILALCCSPEIERGLSIRWGIRTSRLEPVSSQDAMVESVERRLLELNAVERGDRVVIVYGAPVGEGGNTNSVRLHRIR